MNTSLDAWMAQATTIVDVRPDLERGDEPFVRIIESAEATPMGKIVAIIAPFEPAPLYDVLGARGFTHETRKVADNEWIVQFRRVSSSNVANG